MKPIKSWSAEDTSKIFIFPLCLVYIDSWIQPTRNYLYLSEILYCLTSSSVTLLHAIISKSQYLNTCNANHPYFIRKIVNHCATYKIQSQPSCSKQKYLYTTHLTHGKRIISSDMPHQACKNLLCQLNIQLRYHSLGAVSTKK